MASRVNAPEPRENVEEAVKSGDRRRSLVALRDFLAHELEGNRCQTCEMSRLRTGDTAALVLRLTKVMEEIEALPTLGEGPTRLELIRGKKDSKNDGSRRRELEGTAPQSVRRQQGGRHPSGTRKQA